MPKRDITKYYSYFTMQIPSSQTQALIILFLGIFAGMVSSLIVHYGTDTSRLAIAAIGASSGILIISVPTFLTVLTLRLTKRKMKMKHAMFAVLAISIIYALFIIGNAIVYDFLRNGVIAYVILILANASIYGYWFIINKFAIGQKKSAIVTSEIQPLLNIIMYLPFGGYLLNIGVPLNVALMKLFAGMLVFLFMGYLIVYVLDRPAKKKLYVSSVQLFSTMIGQWLYDLNADTKILGSGGVERDVRVDVMTLSSKKGIKAVIVRPDMHYGPFGNVGGSMFTDTLGNDIVNKYGATPFIVHGAVNINDNPMSTKQVNAMTKKVGELVESLSSGKQLTAIGGIGMGKNGPCRAINIRINEVNFLTLSKAPTPTEDIDRDVGNQFEKVANQNKYKTILVDAHNSRYETASKDELRGIYKGSKYIPMYEDAIEKAIHIEGSSVVKLGTAHVRLTKVMKNKDLGGAYSSVAIFGFAKRKFAIIYVDANNVLPGFRESILKHVKSKFGIDAELCTTDTHSVNSIALTARNALGRYTNVGSMQSSVDAMIERALKNMETVRSAYGSFTFKKFKVWGNDSEEIITKVGLDIINIGKHVVPFIIALAFIIAAWIIYIV